MQRSLKLSFVETPFKVETFFPQYAPLNSTKAKIRPSNRVLCQRQNKTKRVSHKTMVYSPLNKYVSKQLPVLNEKKRKNMEEPGLN